MIIRNDDVQIISISEINTLIIDNSASSISIYLLNELIENKVKIIFCNDKHNPCSELVPYSVMYNSPKHVMKEIHWLNDKCEELWKQIVHFKIMYQARLLDRCGYAEKASQLIGYSNDVANGDATNREGHSAKVYFNTLFGKQFNRDDDNNSINAGLNYGYSILLSMFNRQIVNNGYILQIGIHHKGETNPFNLSCDLMEPFRPIIDEIVWNNRKESFDKVYKFKLINIMNTRYRYKGKSEYLSTIIDNYSRVILNNLDKGVIDISVFEYGE